MAHNPVLPSDTVSAGDPSVPPTGGRCIFDDLPAEVLMHIFQLGIAISRSEDAEFSDSGSVVSGDVDPDQLALPWELLVSRICHRWRETAIQTASLWTYLKFTCEGSLARQKEYIKRSRTAPLNIEIDLDSAEEISPPATQRMRDILTIILPHTQHWRSFALRATMYLLIAKTLSLMGQCRSAPLLEVFKLEYGHDEEPSEPFPVQRLKKQAFAIFHSNLPNLKKLSLSGAFLDWPRYHGLSKLTTLELSCHSFDVLPSYSDFTRILCESPYLSALVIGESGPAGKAKDWDPSPVVLPSLKTLTFGYLRISVMTALLQRFAMPILSRLVLDLQEPVSCDTLLHIMSTPNKTTGHSVLSTLEALELGGVDCSKKTLRETYAAAVNLRELKLNMMMLRTSWYKYLGKEDKTTGNVFLPKLENIHILGVREMSAYMMVKWRWTKSQSLKSLYVRTLDHKNLTPLRVEWLHEILQEVEFEPMLSAYETEWDGDSDGAGSDDSKYGSTGEERSDDLRGEDCDSEFDDSDDGFF